MSNDHSGQPAALTSGQSPDHGQPVVIGSGGGFGDFNVRNSTECHLDGQVFARRVDAARYMSQKLGFRLTDAAQYIRELPERDSSPNIAHEPRK